MVSNNMLLSTRKQIGIVQGISTTSASGPRLNTLKPFGLLTWHDIPSHPTTGPEIPSTFSQYMKSLSLCNMYDKNLDYLPSRHGRSGSNCCSPDALVLLLQIFSIVINRFKMANEVVEDESWNGKKRKESLGSCLKWGNESLKMTGWVLK